MNYLCACAHLKGTSQVFDTIILTHYNLLPTVIASFAGFADCTTRLREEKTSSKDLQDGIKAAVLQ